MRFDHARVGVVSSVVALAALTSCGGDSVVTSDASTTTSAAVAATPSTSAPSGVKRDTASGIVERATVTQCKANLASFQVAFEAYNAVNGAYPLDITVVVPQFINEIPAGATLNDARTVLTITEYAITYTLTYDPATGTFDASTIAPPEFAGSGCP
jgi:hypothetical protein